MEKEPSAIVIASQSLQHAVLRPKVLQDFRHVISLK
jgi:hypothetical protein